MAFLNPTLTMILRTLPNHVIDKVKTFHEVNYVSARDKETLFNIVSLNVRLVYCICKFNTVTFSLFQNLLSDSILFFILFKCMIVLFDLCSLYSCLLPLFAPYYIPEKAKSPYFSGYLSIENLNLHQTFILLHRLLISMKVSMF